MNQSTLQQQPQSTYGANNHICTACYMYVQCP